ncbi:DUF4097 family beta strand repeat-containing protein [Streptomyces sp. NPDC093085]|uniref:DUF4097 family beta strand repeat-containing protein n=1 Tax=Streptomyces sp. NPDC093085 TaxID=3155068 RepID=UPI0034270F64
MHTHADGYAQNRAHRHVRTRRPARPARTLLAATGAALLALTVAGCGADPSEAPVEKKSFEYGGKALTIEGGNSAIELSTGDVPDIEVTRQVDGWTFLGSGPKAEWKLSGDTLTLEVKCRALMNNCQALHKVTVPRDVAVEVRTDNGKVTAAGFATPLKLTTDNGSISVQDGRGPLDLTTQNGKITAKGITAPTVKARTDNGSVHLTLRTAPDTVDAATDNGSIDIRVPEAGAPYAVTTATDNGSIDVSVPKDAKSSHVVKARTDNGKITVRGAN